jgi:hypothetical protein
MQGKVEFGSDSWLSLAARVLADVVAEGSDAIAGQRLTISEVLVNPPECLRSPGVKEIAWSFVIADGKSTMVNHAVADADYAVRVDYLAALPNARRVFGTTPKEMEMRSQERRNAAASGRVEVRGSLDNISPAMQRLLFELHNRLARQTL